MALAKTVDVAIVVGGTTSGESEDRPNLSLDHGADALIAAVAAAAPKTIALVAAPGAFLTPWRGQVHAAATLFLGGQESGAAWADVLFGDVAYAAPAPPTRALARPAPPNPWHSRGRLLTLAAPAPRRRPSGRLPLTLPASEAQTIAPSDAPAIEYAEGLATGYRAPNATRDAAFPFGHGLTYTTFAFGTPRVGAAASCAPPQASAATPAAAAADAPAPACAVCLLLPMANAGNATAAAVPQLYLDVPAARWPAPLLRGFRKTAPLAPGAGADVPFCLTARDLSFYDGGWVLAPAATAHFGASAGDLRVSLPLPLWGVTTSAAS